MNAFVIGTALIAASPTIDTTPLFNISPLSDRALAEVRGEGGPTSMSAGVLKRIVDDNGRADLRQAGSVGRIQMDVWWGTVGSELIAESTRAATPR